MKKLGTEAFEEIRTWIYRNARPLDLALWQWNYEGGSRDHVIERLSFYQNEDGGFGSGLEPDCWNPASSPYATMIAVNILRSLGLTDRTHPMIQGVFKYLAETGDCSEEGWFFCIRTNDRWPRAPWMTYDEETNAVQTMGITAALAAFVLRFADPQSPCFAKASGYVDRILERIKKTEDFGEMGAGGLGLLLQDVEESGQSSRFDCSVIKENIVGIVDRSMERDPEKWENYSHRPSEFIWSPGCPFYPGNKEIVEKELDYTIDTRNPGGVWDINWKWFGMDQYNDEFAVSANWWKANKAMEKLHFLKAFDRL